MMPKLLGVLITLSLLVCAVDIQAHHSFAGTFDINKVITVEGTVVEVRWKNPHTMIVVEGKSESGETGTWTFETLPPGVLYRRGLTKNILKHGAQVTMLGHVSHSDPFFAEVTVVTIKDGEVYCIPASGHSRICDPGVGWPAAAED